MKAIIRTADHRFRRHVRTLWESRGGGFYGFVGALTFVYMEAVDLTGDILGLAGVTLSIGTLIGFVVNNFVEAILFTVYAAIWPIQWIGRFGIGLLSGGLLLGAWVVYRLIHPLVLRWLGVPEGGDPTAEAAGRSAGPGE